MKNVYGLVQDGVASLFNVAQLFNDLASQFGGVWNNASLIIDKQDFIVGIGATSWLTGQYVIEAYCADGRSVLLDIQLDPDTGELCRIATPGGSHLGAGGAATCSGCSHCYGKFDDNLQLYACGCLGEGSCSLSNDILA